jgi:hypothetical protein
MPQRVGTTPCESCVIGSLSPHFPESNASELYPDSTDSADVATRHLAYDKNMHLDNSRNNKAQQARGRRHLGLRRPAAQLSNKKSCWARKKSQMNGQKGAISG